MKLKLLSISFTLFTSAAFAGIAQIPTGQINPEIKTAAQNCDNLIKKQANSKLENDEFKKCIESKLVKIPKDSSKNPQK